MQTETIKSKITSVTPDTPEDHPSRDRIGVEYEVTKNMPTTIAESIDEWGEEVCFSRLRGAVVIDLQSFVRTKIKHKDFSADELQVVVDGWGPSQRGPGVSLEQRAESLMANMSDDDLAKLMARVEERKAS